MLTPTYQIPDLPPPHELETKAVLKAAARAHRHLAELKGTAESIPNQGILINTLSLQEAKASSEVENIVTTQDELFSASLFPDGPTSLAAKEVKLYREALRSGFIELDRKQGLITNNLLILLFQILKENDGGFRTTPGTVLKNEHKNEVVYVPPQHVNDIQAHMSALERFINEDTGDLDLLVKMALIHHQFESIHPFPDGNGRIGRILNVLYLTKTGLLDTPILYLSRAINQSKDEYYRLLQSVRDSSDWQAWLIYMLDAVTETSISTLTLIEDIRDLMALYKREIRSNFSKFYSQDLLNNLFRHPYTKIEYIQNDLQVTRQTATRYLDQLSQAGLLKKQSSGKNNYYVNEPLIALFLKVSE